MRAVVRGEVVRDASANLLQAEVARGVRLARPDVIARFCSIATGSRQPIGDLKVGDVLRVGDALGDAGARRGIRLIGFWCIVVVHAADDGESGDEGKRSRKASGMGHGASVVSWKHRAHQLRTHDPSPESAGGVGARAVGLRGVALERLVDDAPSVGLVLCAALGLRPQIVQRARVTQLDERVAAGRAPLFSAALFVRRLHVCQSCPDASE